MQHPEKQTLSIEDRIEKIEILLSCLRYVTPDVEFQSCIDRAEQALDEALIAYGNVSN